VIAMQIMQGKHLRLIGALDSGVAGWYISPNGYDLYRTGAGDSLVVLANRYLGSASRAGEIWALQSSGWRSARNDDINNVERGAELIMPQEAIDKATALGQIADGGGRGEAPSKAASGKVLQGGTDVLKGSSNTPSIPSVIRPSTPSPSSVIVAPPSSTTPSNVTKIALGALGVVIAGGAIAYGVHKFGGRRKRNPARKVNGYVRGIHVDRVYLNRGGYTSRGRYFGVGDPLFRVYTNDGGLDRYVRAKNAKIARASAVTTRK
jgi:hypothetical protein